MKTVKRQNSKEKPVFRQLFLQTLINFDSKLLNRFRKMTSSYNPKLALQLPQKKCTVRVHTEQIRDREFHSPNTIRRVSRVARTINKWRQCAAHSLRLTHVFERGWGTLLPGYTTGLKKIKKEERKINNTITKKNKYKHIGFFLYDCNDNVCMLHYMSKLNQYLNLNNKMIYKCDG